jgi:putative PIN family toxin of toxin-antitoxin system
VRVFLDTNVLISAFTARGLCADLMRMVLADHELVTSERVLSEFQGVLARRFGYAPQTIDEATALLREHDVEPTPDELPDIEFRDADDLPILGAAIASGADVLVTGDRDLLAVRGEVGIAIADPRRFWAMLGGT